MRFSFSNFVLLRVRRIKLPFSFVHHAGLVLNLVIKKWVQPVLQLRTTDSCFLSQDQKPSHSPWAGFNWAAKIMSSLPWWNKVAQCSKVKKMPLINKHILQRLLCADRYPKALNENILCKKKKSVTKIFNSAKNKSMGMKQHSSTTKVLLHALKVRV